MTTEDTRERTTRDADADDHRRLIDRIDKTIIALLYERERLGARLDRLQEDTGTMQGDADERDR